MPIPNGIRAIDLMMNIPDGDPTAWYEFIKPLLLDEESRKVFAMPAQYMFKGVPHGWGEGRDPIEVTLEEMDKWSIKQALVGVGPLGGPSAEALKNHPDRFLGNVQESAGRDDLAVVATPADQRFEADDPPAGERDDRLVERLDPSVVERRQQRGFAGFVVAGDDGESIAQRRDRGLTDEAAEVLDLDTSELHAPPRSRCSRRWSR